MRYHRFATIGVELEAVIRVPFAVATARKAPPETSIAKASVPETPFARMPAPSGCAVVVGWTQAISVKDRSKSKASESGTTRRAELLPKLHALPTRPWIVPVHVAPATLPAPPLPLRSWRSPEPVLVA